MRRKTQADALRTTARARSPAHRSTSRVTSAQVRAILFHAVWKPSRRHSQQFSLNLQPRLASSSPVVSWCCCVVEVGMGVGVVVEWGVGVGVVVVVVVGVVVGGAGAPRFLSSMAAVGVTGVVVVVADVVEEKRKERSPAPAPAPAGASACGSGAPSGSRASVEVYDRRSPASTTGRLELER